MEKQTYSVRQYLDEIWVPLRTGLTILLTVVATGTDAKPDYDLCDEEAIESSVTIPQTNIDITLNDNELSQDEGDFYTSLISHRGNLLTSQQEEDFLFVAKQVKKLNVVDSMICFDQEDNQITYDLLTKGGFVLHLSQYFEAPTDQIVFSVEKNDEFLFAGHAPKESIGEYLKDRISENKQMA